MINRLTVSNYRSLGPSTVIELGKLTAFVGPNGAGKSNITDVLRFVANSLSVGLEAAITTRHGIRAVRRWSGGRPFDMSIRADLCSSEFIGAYEFVLASDRDEEYRVKREVAEIASSAAGRHRFEVLDGEWVEGPEGVRPKVVPQALAMPLLAGDERFQPIADALTNLEVYAIYPDTLREPQKPEPARPMQQHGKNWCSILKGLDEQAWAPELRAAVGKLTGDVDDIRVRQVGGYLIAEFHHVQSDSDNKRRREKWFDAAQESDGTLRVAGILTALLQEPALTLIGVEEPELTVHPGALPLLFDYLKQASNTSQVIVTTHSPDLLEHFDADDVRVVDRVNGVTYVSPMDDSQLAAVKSRLLSLGDLVRMEGLKPSSREPAQSFDF